jgi:hypothetical protein
MKTWKKFAHIDAKTVDEAASILRKGNAAAISGGTDMLGAMRFEILPTYPEVVVNLKSIPDLDYIREEGGVLKIGALARLEDIAKNKPSGEDCLYLNILTPAKKAADKLPVMVWLHGGGLRYGNGNSALSVNPGLPLHGEALVSMVGVELPAFRINPQNDR